MGRRLITVHAVDSREGVLRVRIGVNVDAGDGAEPRDERLAHFESWSTSDEPLRRQIALGLRKLLALVFYDHPAVWPHLGYDGPMFRPVTAP